jgi:hypothetical protein
LLLAGFALLVWRARHIDEFTRAWIVSDLERRFQSEVRLERLHIGAFPEFTVTGEDLSIAYHNRADQPPFFHVDKFVFRLGWLGVFAVPHRIRAVQVERLTITISRRGERNSAAEKPLFRDAQQVEVGEIRCLDTDLVVLPKDPRKEGLDWAIHDLVLHAVRADRAFHFLGTLRNAKPVGEIRTEGDFGPWVLDEPGDTPVEGSYSFADANLDPFPGIGGTLSSTGTYRGKLAELAVLGQTSVPNFSLDPVGKPVPLKTEFSATVDGTTGDTLLHPVRATLGRSLILAEGHIVNVKGQGHDILLELSAPAARMEDLLSLALKSDTPLMTGAAKIKAQLHLPPGKAKVLEKMVLDGQFGVDDARWSNLEVREKLEALSRTAEGHPKDEDAGSAISDLRGRFHLEKGVIRFSELAFHVPGAAIELAGTYEISGGAVDLKGRLRTKATLSEMTTGTKSLLLKAIDPFFKKNGAGAEVPITVTGTRGNVTVGATVFRKTVKRKVSSSTEDRR